MQEINIYGTTVRIPDIPENTASILYNDLPEISRSGNVWNYPDYFETVEYDKQGEYITYSRTKGLRRRGSKGCKNGIFAKIGGVVKGIFQKNTISIFSIIHWRTAHRLNSVKQMDILLFLEYWQR